MVSLLWDGLLLLCLLRCLNVAGVENSARVLLALPVSLFPLGRSKTLAPAAQSISVTLLNCSSDTVSHAVVMCRATSKSCWPLVQLASCILPSTSIISIVLHYSRAASARLQGPLLFLFRRPDDSILSLLMFLVWCRCMCAC